MLLCKQMSCLWHLVYVDKDNHDPFTRNKGDDMSETAAFHLAPSPTLFGRLMATIDRLLMASARIAIRNGDLPYFGL
jgi:hypothetical protein